MSREVARPTFDVIHRFNWSTQHLGDYGNTLLLFILRLCAGVKTYSFRAMNPIKLNVMKFGQSLNLGLSKGLVRLDEADEVVHFESQ